MNNCIDCKKEIKKQSTRCSDCHKKYMQSDEYGNVGGIYGDLTVINTAYIEDKKRFVNVNCKCGENDIKLFADVKGGKIVRCSSCGKKGENHWNWQGGKKDEVERIRGTNEYKNWRQECFERDGYVCQISGKKGSGGDLNVHHITPLSVLYKNGEPLFDIDNGITINKNMHSWFHGLYGKVSTKEDFEYFKNNIVGGECKADLYNFHKGIENGNAYIEFESYGKPSGIFKKEKYSLKYWIHSLSPNEFFIMDGRKFRRWVGERIDDCKANSSLTSKGFRVTVGGDGNRTRGLLVPVAELKKQAIKIYNIT